MSHVTVTSLISGKEKKARRSTPAKSDSADDFRKMLETFTLQL